MRIKKLDLFFLASKLDKFLLFNNFFFNLANFWNLTNFLSFYFFNLDNFLIFSFINFLINLLLLLISPILLIINFLLAINTYNNRIIFNININNTVILLKP